MSKKWLYACMPISGLIMVIYSVKNMYLELAAILRPEERSALGNGDTIAH